jgi:hypothetical protein
VTLLAPPPVCRDPDPEEADHDHDHVYDHDADRSVPADREPLGYSVT